MVTSENNTPTANRIEPLRTVYRQWLQAYFVKTSTKTNGFSHPG
jgi:hypothetical protein